MLIQHPDRNSKKGAALIMVMLSGMLIVILGIGMLFFYQKQVERRMKLEFDIHRRLAAKSGFNLIQYNHGTTGTYVYAVGGNRPAILVTVGEALPIYDEDEASSFENMSNWIARADGGCAVALGADGAEFEFSTTNAAIGHRNELVFSGTNDVAWNHYPFGLCYDVLLRNAGGSSNSFPWVGYVYAGVSNDWNQMFITNATALLAVAAIGQNDRRLDLYEHTLNPGGMPTNSISLAGSNERDQMFVDTELYLDRAHIGFGSKAGNYVGVDLPPIFSSITNVTMGVGGFNRDVATNRTLNLSKFVVRNPYEYEIYLSWTNRNRFFGSTGIFTNVLATVVDATPDKKKYYFFDSFETVVP